MKGIFKMDYSNGITVFIGNEGFYAEGELRDCAITLPVSGSELQGFLEGNGLVTPMHEETYIADFLDGVPFDHPEIFAHATAEQMNILAQQLKMADPDDLDKVQDWIDAFDTPKNIVELMNLVEDAESINRVEYEFSTNGLDKEEAYVFHLIDNDPDLQKITERYPGLKIVDYGQIVIDEVTLLDDGFIDPIGSSPDLNKHSLNELKELIGEEYDRQNDKGFFEEEQVGLSDLMGTLRDAAEHKHDTRDNTHSHDIDAR